MKLEEKAKELFLKGASIFCSKRSNRNLLVPDCPRSAGHCRECPFYNSNSNPSSRTCEITDFFSGISYEERDEAVRTILRENPGLIFLLKVFGSKGQLIF